MFEGTDHVKTIRTAIERLADKSNWRETSLEGDDEASYDAMAWSPQGCLVNASGRVDDPNFHTPWKLAAAALEALTAMQEERERMRAAFGHIARECVTNSESLDRSEIYHQCYVALVGDFTLPAFEQSEIMRVAIDAAIGEPAPPQEERVQMSKRDGVFEKFRVERTDGKSAPGEKHYGCEYFILDTIHDPHARPALLAYADSCESKYPDLAADARRMAAGERLLTDDPDIDADTGTPDDEIDTAVVDALRQRIAASGLTNGAYLAAQFAAFDALTPEQISAFREARDAAPDTPQSQPLSEDADDRDFRPDQVYAKDARASRCNFCGKTARVDRFGHCKQCVDGMERTNGD